MQYNRNRKIPFKLIKSPLMKAIFHKRVVIQKFWEEKFKKKVSLSCGWNLYRSFCQSWPLSDKGRLQSSLFFFPEKYFCFLARLAEKTETQKEGKSFIYSNSFVARDI
jgi:hypothetical protein